VWDVVQRPAGVSPISNRGLAQYVGALVVGVLVVQGYTAVATDGRLTIGTALLLVVVALYVMVFTVRNATALRLRAYATYFAHALAYLIVNGSFWVHAWILMLSGRAEVLQEGWSGPLIWMSALWGSALLVHTIGAMLSKGYELVES
jgi:hypothetical protein